MLKMRINLRDEIYHRQIDYAVSIQRIMGCFEIGLISTINKTENKKIKILLEFDPNRIKNSRISQDIHISMDMQQCQNGCLGLWKSIYI